MKVILTLILLVVISATGHASGCHETPGWAGMVQAEIQLERDGETISRTVRLADEAAERAAGYQWVCPEQARDTAVLFVFPRAISSAFHMRNVYVPLDIHFFDRQGKQVDAFVMRPEPPGHAARPRYYLASKPFSYALEIARPQTDALQSAPANLRLLVESSNINP